MLVWLRKIREDLQNSFSYKKSVSSGVFPTSSANQARHSLVVGRSRALRAKLTFSVGRTRPDPEADRGGAEAARLSPLDRSLITVAALVALYRTNELRYPLKRALANGVSKDELIELITHLAFYSGSPTANSALAIARRVFQETD